MERSSCLIGFYKIQLYKYICKRVKDCCTVKLYRIYGRWLNSRQFHVKNCFVFKFDDIVYCLLHIIMETYSSSRSQWENKFCNCIVSVCAIPIHCYPFK